MTETKESNVTPGAYLKDRTLPFVEVLTPGTTGQGSCLHCPTHNTHLLAGSLNWWASHPSRKITLGLS